MQLHNNVTFQGAPPYVRAKVNLANIVVLEYGGVTGIGGVVSSTVVNGTARGESKTWAEMRNLRKKHLYSQPG